MLNSVGDRYLDVPRLIWQHQNTKSDGPHDPSPSKEALEHMVDHLQLRYLPFFSPERNSSSLQESDQSHEIVSERLGRGNLCSHSLLHVYSLRISLSALF